MMIQFRQDWVNDVNMMQRELNRLLDYFTGAKPPMVKFSPTVWKPAIDVYQTDGEFVVTVELAGLKDTDFQVTINHNIFTIRGERRKLLSGNKSGAYYQMEIVSGPFERSITLPEAVDVENARASYENGLVVVIIPKVKTEGTTRVEIRVT